MTLVFAAAAACLFGIGAYLLLSRDVLRLVFGVVVISQSAVLTLIASGLSRGSPPIAPPPDAPVSDPLSQAMALTGIVIGTAITALLLALVLRVVRAYASPQLEDVKDEEAERDARVEREGARRQRAEEAAVR